MTHNVAVVTGAAGDIGRAIAARLADSHDIVVLADIDPAAIETALRMRPQAVPGADTAALLPRMLTQQHPVRRLQAAATA